MDPSQYQFTPNSVIPQESKLATYMNRQPLKSALPASQASSNKDYIQNAFYSSMEITNTRESSSIHLTNAQLSAAQMSAAQLSAAQISAAQLSAAQLSSSQLTASQLTAAQIATPSHQILQENVGGTTYFYPSNTTADQSTINQQQASNLETQNSIITSSAINFNVPTFYPRTTSEVSTHQSGAKPGLTSFYLPGDVRAEIMLRNEISQIQSDPVHYPDLPTQVENYVDLIPLDGCTLNTLHSCFRAVHAINGNQVVLRRLHDFRLSSTKCPTLIDEWKYLQHPNVVRLREVFTTKAFGDTSLIFVFDFHPASVSLAQQYAIRGSHESNGSAFGDFSNDPDAPRPYTHQKNSLLRAVHGGTLLPESTIWSLLIQLTAALKNIHSLGLACRKLDPRKVIIAGNRLRLAWCGVEEIAGTIGGGSGAIITDPEVAQQEDLTALGRMVLFLACRTVIPLDLTHSQVQYIMRGYSPDLKNLLLYLLTISPRRSVIDLMPMIGARFYIQIEALERRVDTMETELATEIDNARLLNLLVKLSTVNERPDLNMDVTWAETGERYILKLFRDYLFHSVTPDGKPWLDYSHLVYNLNQLDAGTHYKIQLMSRDHKIILIVTFAELRCALEQSYNEVRAAANTSHGGI